MTTTILAAIALSGSLVSTAKPEFQAQTDYGQAMRQAATEGKPMAVLIGHGNTFAKMMGDATLPEATAKLLRDKYVCVTVDVDTATGAQLASQFQLTNGLVISSAGGTHQALRQAGAVSTADLTKHAATFVGASGTPATTVTVGTPVVTSTSGYTPITPNFGTVIQSNCAGGNCPTIQDYYSSPSSGGCANGQCPTPTTTKFRRR